MIGKVLLGLGLAGLLGYGLVSSTKSAPVMPGGDIPDNVREIIEKALDSADPETIRVVAAKVKALGYTAQAESLRVAANEIESQMKRIEATKPPTTPVPKAPSVQQGPAVGTAIKGPEDQVARNLAGAVANMLRTATKSTADRKMVAAYQTQENARGQAVGKVDGLYGSKTALTLALDHGIAPPKPLYWPTNALQQKAAKAFYKGELMKLAASDSARREEWTQAAQV